MAKPIPVVVSAAVASSSTQPRRPRRTRPSLFPSSALLSALAGIVAASPVVAGSPAPPSFLCPVLAPPHTPTKTIQRRSYPPVSALQRPKSRRALTPTRSGRILPYKYEPGKDGVWRRVESYSLYGSTLCSNCREPTHAVSADEISTGPSPSPTTTDLTDLHDSLPAGWASPPSRNENRTTLILALSLVLAFFICFFIIGCLFWRKNVRRKHNNSDVEMKAQRRRSRSASVTSTPTQPQVDLEKEIKAKQKIWARATARWKANARFTARKRRGKRPVSSISSQPLDSTTTLNPSTRVDPDDALDSMAPTQHTSRNVSRRESFNSVRDAPPASDQPPEHIDNSPSITVDPAPDEPSSPPAYRRGTLITPIIIPPGGLSVPDERAGSTLLVPSPRPSHLSFDTYSIEAKSSVQSQEADSPQLSVHAAHVATDDKALLARLADLAERPPELLNNAESSHQVSVPVWEDEQMEDFGRTPESSAPDTSGSTSLSPFPPPPSKGKMAEASFYAYRYSFEEFSDLIEPELEPSAPPFEAPGAPVTGDMVMLPSAPPLVEDRFLLEVYPSAPQFEAAAEGDAERDPSRANNNRSVEHQSHQPPPTSRPTSEGTLPGYHP
ncbi:hypothetical protein P691DRAFT_796850 [Macrolepiota fuliginosa MF-IS2]|uniref:Uncharacterized protein n=1 Tax=Macrolepiota fuliginosa MF-IS2 TaxID=1400762 RepID=A0A9P5XIM2_9AGAR|nr:hypothetical protein P691DRAFT_796850 [Macrolepiota fuliginosa MF-IS2]